MPSQIMKNQKDREDTLGLERDTILRQPLFHIVALGPQGFLTHAGVCGSTALRCTVQY